MKRFTSFFTVLLITLFISSGLAASPVQEITGEVTLVGDNVVRIQDNSGQVYNLQAAQSKLKDVSTGYRVQATEKDGKLVNIEVIGVPVVVKPTVIIKKTVIVN